MNKNLIRISAAIILASPWLYLGSTLRDVMYVILSIIIILATVDISKKKKSDVV